jgi:hypothetical protein
VGVGRSRELQPVSERQRPQKLEERPIEFSLWERITLGIDAGIDKIKQGWQITRFIAMALPLTVKLKVGLDMNNDKKTTVLGWLKGIVGALATVFLADKVADPSGFSQMIVVAVGSVWAVVEVVQGIFTNKPEKK